jgi:hypothetical protein
MIKYIGAGILKNEKIIRTMGEKRTRWSRMGGRGKTRYQGGAHVRRDTHLLHYHIIECPVAKFIH